MENPLINPISRLEKKVSFLLSYFFSWYLCLFKISAGAEAIVTQPPLLPEAFSRWWEEVIDEGWVNHQHFTPLPVAGIFCFMYFFLISFSLQKEVPIIVGIPVISSLNNFRFWLHLTGAMG